MTRATKPHCFEIDGQHYTVVGTKDHWTNSGKYIELVSYEAVCAHPGCSRVFRYAAPKTNVRRKEVNRRCERHKAPGLPVGPAVREKFKPKTVAKRPARPAHRVKRNPTALTSPEPCYLD